MSPHPAPLPRPLIPLVLLLLALLFAGCGAPPERAAWLIRYDADTPAEIAAACEEARGAKLDRLLVQVRGRADAYYQSSVAPRGETLNEVPADFDPLAEVIAACDPIPVHAWLNVYYLWGDEAPPNDADHPGRPERPWILRDADGRSVADYSMEERARRWIEGVYADPASKAYRRLLVRAVDEIVRNYPVAGIHLDFVRYPGPAYGQGGPLGSRFASRWGIDPRWLPVTSPTPAELDAWLAGSLPAADRLLTTANLLWAETRAAEVTALVAAVRHALDRTGRPLALTAAVVPDDHAAFFGHGQDWYRWATTGLVDGLYAMAYFGSVARVEAQLHEIASAARPGLRLAAGLGAYIKEPAAIAQEAAAAGRLGFDTISLFSLGHLLRQGKSLSAYLEPLPRRRCLVLPLPRKPRSAMIRERLRAQLKGDEAGPGNDWPDRNIAARLQEFQAARPLLARIVGELASGPQPMPPWVEGRTLFRFVHRWDEPGVRQEQRDLCRQARDRLIAGEPFAVVASELSQGGSRDQGGIMERRFLTADDPVDRQLAALGLGRISGVIAVDNGFRLFQIDDRSRGGAMTPFDQLPWSARRILLRQRLQEALAEAGQQVR